MTNVTKWLVALPFAFLIAFMIPALIAGDWLWFINDWGAVLYVTLTAGMWLMATGFVDVEKPRAAPDAANRLIPLGLLLSVPVSIVDRLWGPARSLPDGWVILAALIGLSAIVLGIRARTVLGAAYSPRRSARGQTNLIRHGPYNYIRHPLYFAAILWCIGWPLFIKSLFGCLAALAFLLPALRIRIEGEEEELVRIFGEEYRTYQQETWRLIPFIY